MVKAVVLDLDRTVFSRQRYDGHLHNACASIYGADMEQTTLKGRNLLWENLGWNSKEIINDFLLEINGTTPSTHYAQLFDMLRTLEQRSVPVYYCSSTLFPGAAELLLEAIHQQAGIAPFRKQTVEDIKAHGIQAGGLVTLRDSLPLNPNEWGDVDPNTNDKYTLLSETGRVDLQAEDLLLLDDSRNNCNAWQQHGGHAINFTGPEHFSEVLRTCEAMTAIQVPPLQDVALNDNENQPLIAPTTEVANGCCICSCLSHIISQLRGEATVPAV